MSDIIQNILDILKERGNDYDWDRRARPEQLIPEGDWGIWLILAGRGFGKTRTGSEAVKSLVQRGYKNICLLGETMMDVRKVMIEGESGLLNIYHQADKPIYYPSNEVVVWPNGAKAHVFSSENPDSLRGPQFDCAWIDELAKFAKAKECWDQLMMTMRLGDPKIIITTTPKPIQLLRDLLEKPRTTVSRGSTLDNASNLPESFINSILQEYGDTDFGKQEIYAEILDDSKLRLWKPESILYCDELPHMDDIVVAVDPAVTNGQYSDETGIIVAGVSDGKYYILEDLSTKAYVSEWAELVIDAFYRYDASRLVIEINQGGDLCKEVLLQLDYSVNIVPVRAVKNKEARAQPIGILYEKGRVFHSKEFTMLEQQMLSFGQTDKSPDRVDALVWAINQLKSLGFGGLT